MLISSWSFYCILPEVLRIPFHNVGLSLDLGSISSFVSISDVNEGDACYNLAALFFTYTGFSISLLVLCWLLSEAVSRRGRRAFSDELYFKLLFFLSRGFWYDCCGGCCYYILVEEFDFSICASLTTVLIVLLIITGCFNGGAFSFILLFCWV